MSRLNINKFPMKIYSNNYYKLSSNTEINEEDIQETIDKDVKDYINRNVEEYKEEYIEKITKDLKISFAREYINKYLDTSYLINLRSDSIDSKVIQKYDEEIDKTEKSEEVREVYKAFNKIIRKISKDRPNDFNRTINSIRESVNEYKEDLIEDKDVNEAIEDLIEEAEVKVDKLSKYVKETTKTLYKTVLDNMTIAYNKCKLKFIEEHSSEINEVTKKYKEDFKNKYEADITKNKTDNIVNLREYIFKNHLDKIHFIEAGDIIILVYKIIYEHDILYFFSDKTSPEIIQVNVNDVDYLKRIGDSFTAVLRKED